MVASMAVSAFAAGEAVDTAEYTGKEPASATTVALTGDTLKITVNGTVVTGSGANVTEAAVALYNNLPSDVDADLFLTATTLGKVFLGADGNYLRIYDTDATVTAQTGATVKTSTSSSKAVWQTNYDEIVDTRALAEKDDWNGKDGVKPGKKIYFRIKGAFADLDVFKFDVSKGENAKQIKKVSVVEKRFGDGLETIDGKVLVDPDERATVIQVELVDNMTDNEYKVSFDMKVKVDDKNGATIGGVFFKKGTSSDKFEEIGATWMYNTTDTTDDTEFMAGTGGIMVKPVKNEENTVLWTDENRDLARLTFTADSDVAKYFPKLSTKWPNATYAQLFDDQDAFVFDFVGNPKISSTSRAVLELFCPFLDSDDEYSVDPESVVIYQVADDATLAASTEVELAKAILDGRLIDVTDKFTAGENEDGDFVYTTKTRTLGTYIIAEKAPSEEAFEEAEGEAPVEEPTENTEKPNPGTGR